MNISFTFNPLLEEPFKVFLANNKEDIANAFTLKWLEERVQGVSGEQHQYLIDLFVSFMAANLALVSDSFNGSTDTIGFPYVLPFILS